MTVFALVASALLAAAPTARELNTQGYRLYQEQRFPEALELFQKAMQQDPRFALAHYNYAATLGRLRTLGQVCQHDAYKRTILEHLERSIALDSRRRERMKTDSDFDSVKDTVGYQRLLGRSPARLGDVGALVAAVSWFGESRGAYGPRSGARFEANGKVSLWLQLTEPEPHRQTATGTYTLRGRAVTITLATPLGGKTQLKGQLTSRGKLVFDEPLGPMTDDPDECSA